MCYKIIKLVNSEKDLGVVVTHNLTWTANSITFFQIFYDLVPKKKYIKQNVSHKQTKRI